MKKKKAFDCVELQHRGALKIYKETKGMSIEQELAYWKEKSEQVNPHAGQPIKTSRRPSIHQKRDTHDR
jgi:hypothetical protein